MRSPERTTFGTTDLEITRVGLGAWAMGGGDWPGGWGQQDDTESVAAIQRAVELGVNWIDTAPAYGFGRSETVVGQAVRDLPSPKRPYIFTKCGLVWEPGTHELTNSLAPSSIRRECEASLQRLQCDRLDVLHAHWPTWDDTPLEASWIEMAELVDEGLVRYIGLSNFGVDELERCDRVRHVDTYQPELNLLVRGAAEEALGWCAEHGTGVIAYSPMRSGLLTGAFSAERVAALPDDDWRVGDDDFKEPGLSRNLSLVERLAPIAERLGLSLPELSIAWTTAWPQVDGAIVGARNPRQVDGWINAANLVLGEKDLDEIAALLGETGAGTGPTRPSGVRS